MRLPPFLRHACGARQAWAQCFLAVALGACADQAAPPADPAVTVPAPSASLVAGGEYSWQANQMPVDMGPGISGGSFKLPRFCYLTRIGGAYTVSSGTFVQRVGNPGTWIGYSQGVNGNNVRGSARCVTVLAVSQQYDWSTDDGPYPLVIPLDPAKWACALTGIQGDFYSGYSGAELLRGPPSSAHGGFWTLGATNLAKKSQVLLAQCFKPVTGDATPVAVGTWLHTDGTYKALSSTSNTVCVLDQVHGHLNPSSQFVHIKKGSNTWELWGWQEWASQGLKLSAHSSCYT